VTRRFFRRAGLQFSSGLAAAASPRPPQSAEPLLKAGFAERDITPDIGMEQPGGYGKVFLRTYHDPCKVRAAVFDDGSVAAALVGIDSLVIPRSVVLAARERIRTKCGLPGEAVMVGASHSHSSGPVGMVLPGEYDHAPADVRKLAYEHSSMANAAYLKRVEDAIVEAVASAHAERSGSRCNFGSGREDKVAFNRRFRMKSGQSWSHPGQNNPDIIEPAGPIDPVVGVIGAWDAEGRLKGCVVNYCCHATTSPGGISANWIHYMERMIQGMLGPQVAVVFLQGFSGDVTQVDNRNPYRQPSGAEYAELVGGRVGAEAVRVLLRTHAGAGGPVAASARVFQSPRRRPSPERLQRAREIVKRDPKTTDSTEWTFAKETVMLDAHLQKWPEIDVEVQAVQVGPVVAISAPGEMFCQFGLDLRAGSGFQLTFPVELANGSVGYVPTEEALSKTGGGYETRLTSYSNLEPGAGRRMVQTGVDLAKRLKPGRFPEPPRAPAFNPDTSGIGSHPWSYGNVPPELS
jgi:neutral ceramidase